MVTEHCPDRYLLDLKVAFGPHHNPTEPSRYYSLPFAWPMCSPGSLPLSPVASSLKPLVPGRAVLCKEEQAHWFFSFSLTSTGHSWRGSPLRALMGFQNPTSRGLNVPIVSHGCAALAQAQSKE